MTYLYEGGYQSYFFSFFLLFATMKVVNNFDLAIYHSEITTCIMDFFEQGGSYSAVFVYTDKIVLCFYLIVQKLPKNPKRILSYGISSVIFKKPLHRILQ